MREIKDTKMFTAIRGKFSVRIKEGFNHGDDTHHKLYGNKDRREFETWELVFGTYAPNVPDAEDYTVEDALNLADDPELLKIFPPPFFVTSLDSGDRSVLSLERHAAGSLATWVQQPGEHPLEFIVIKASVEEPAFTADILGEIKKCSAPEKHVYGCVSCLESQTEFENSCVFKKVLCPTEDPIACTVRYGHKLAGFLPSRKHWVKDHIFVSATMLHNKDERKFQGVRDITFADLDFSNYGELYERKCDALAERQNTLRNVKQYCTKCPMVDICADTFRWKRRGCCNPRPNLSVIAEEIINRSSPVISKRVIAEILEASGRHRVTNRRTGRVSRSTIGLSELNRGLGFCVHRVSDNVILESGTTELEWEEFKKREALELHESGVMQNLNLLEDPLTYATVIACANIQGSPRHVSAWRSTSYPYMYSDLTYGGNITVHFHKPSKRDVAPWPLDISSLTTLFEHYGNIPGSRW